MSEVPQPIGSERPLFIEGVIDARELGNGGPFLPPPNYEQSDSEFFWMMAKVGRLNSVLEIGSREGGMLRQMSQFLNPGSRVCSIDIGEKHPEWQNGRDTVPFLQKTILELRGLGFNAELLLGNSRMKESIEWARERSPFDLIFVDADHRYEAVWRDWKNYSPFAKIIGFHDIANEGISELWTEIKDSGVRTEEMIAATGIGLVWL